MKSFFNLALTVPEQYKIKKWVTHPELFLIGE